MKVLTVIGARPQFIKAAVVSRVFDKAGVREIVVHTGQHFDASMSDIFFTQLEMKQPAYNLAVGGGGHAYNTGRAMEGIEQIVAVEKPDVVLVYGDTDSTLAGALVAAKAGVALAHVEAGLRSFNRRMPEEINRILTDHISSFLFAPSGVAVRNLTGEGISADKILVVGDVMVDAVRLFAPLAARRSEILARLGLEEKAYILATVHRKENTEDPKTLAAMLVGLAASSLPVVLPLHPRTRNVIEQSGITVPLGIELIEPVGYLDMLALEQQAALIATDSGGVQKEAFYLGVPCITMRSETEWTELVDLGANKLTGADTTRIADAISQGPWPVAQSDVYGSGDAAERICLHLLEALVPEKSLGPHLHEGMPVASPTP